MTSNKNIAVVLSCNGMGDMLSAVPTIRLLHNLHDKKVHVYSPNKDLFKNYKYIVSNNLENVQEVENNSEWMVFKTFDTSVDLHPRMDIRQFHASKLGLQLLPEEMYVDFYPDEYKPIKNLPQNYVVIHPVETWPSRTWEEERWQIFVDELYNKGIPVVAIGKSSSEVGTYNTQKPTYSVNIKNGLNLMNRTTIDQTWHVVNKSTVIVTMDSGLLHIAGSTDTAIVQLGSSIDNRLRAPYRKGRQDYKYSYVSGKCKIFCASNPSYYIKYNNSFKTIAPLPFCLEEPKSIGKQDVDPEVYKCHPFVSDVTNETIRLYNLYKKEKIVRKGKNFKIDKNTDSTGSFSL